MLCSKSSLMAVFCNMRPLLFKRNTVPSVSKNIDSQITAKARLVPPQRRLVSSLLHSLWVCGIEVREMIERNWTCMLPMDSRLNAANLGRLRGGSIQIHVGTASSNQGTETSVSNKWFLPQNLISHYSPFLQAACSWGFRENRDERIELPEDDPTVFGLFVEWMYYGSYDILPLTPYSSIDAKCWVFGDKLLRG